MVNRHSSHSLQESFKDVEELDTLPFFRSTTAEERLGLSVCGAMKKRVW